ncbi:MAG: hypothetical protein EBZ74_01880 [Planctomycetia bacterium]|nr:hypothetical protein [Planctomycetia bacterium]
MLACRVFRAGCGLVLVAATAGVVPAADAVTSWSDGGSSSREARRQAVEALPLDRMPRSARRAAEQVLRSTTLYRRLPVQTLACDAALLEFSLAHPEAIVDLWRVLGISRFALDPAGPAQWRLADGYGTVGVLRLLHHERQGAGGMLVLHGRGGYSGAVTPRPLTGGCLLLVRHHPEPPAADGTPRHAVQVDAFLDVDGTGLEIVTRTLHPLIVRSAASNLEEVCVFMETLSAAAARNPAGVERLAARLARTDPADRATLAAIAREAGRGTAREDDADRWQANLAARWLPAEDLDTLRR